MSTGDTAHSRRGRAVRLPSAPLRGWTSERSEAASGWQRGGSTAPPPVRRPTLGGGSALTELCGLELAWAVGSVFPPVRPSACPFREPHVPCH